MCKLCFLEYDVHDPLVICDYCQHDVYTSSIEKVTPNGRICRKCVRIFEKSFDGKTEVGV